jgi:hypothetical protein
MWLLRNPSPRNVLITIGRLPFRMDALLPGTQLHNPSTGGAMATQQRLRLRSLARRWLVGMTVISLRYLWATVPMHRVEVRETAPQLPPPIPPHVPTTDLMGWECGVGPMYHRTFHVDIDGARTEADELMRVVVSEFDRLVPQEVVQVHLRTATDRPLAVGDDLVVDMPGPWNGPVRVVEVGVDRLRLATLQGHLEAGQIQFSTLDGATAESPLAFEVETWARAANHRVDLLYSRLRLAKEIQLNMWVRLCQAVAARAGGRCREGIHIRTAVAPAPDPVRP